MSEHVAQEQEQDQDMGLPLDLLPPLLQEFVRLIGLPATMALVQRLGGVRIYIPTPERCTAEHALAGVIGLNHLRTLAQAMGGLPHFQLPKAERALLAVRNAQMVAQARHLSNREIALRHGLTEDHVRRILSREGAGEQHASAQQRLF